MASYVINNIAFKENGDYLFRLAFTYSGVPMETPDISRSATTADIQGVIANTIEIYVNKRADTNYQNLKTSFDGKSNVTITV